MTTDPLVLSDDLDRADARLLTTIAALTPDDVAAPSLLPGWTRGHVLTHLARNADALGNLLTWAATGIETPAYPSPDARVAGIEAGAGRPVDEQIDDVRDACARFSAQVAAMPASAWAFVFTPAQGSAAKVVWRRLREVEVHHVDLGCAYATADWPEAFTSRLMKELTLDRPVEPPLVLRTESGAIWRLGAGTGETTVTGPAHALAGWLSGRSSGERLTMTPPGPLPTIPDWI